MRPLSPAINALGLAALLALPTAHAEEPVQVLASFSILADMVENVGGEHVEVTSLVGPNSDAHVYSPRPTDARALAEADLVVFNGLQFEGWMERLVAASDYTGPLVVTTEGIEGLVDAEHEEHGGHNEHDYSDQDEQHGDQDAHGHASQDAHDHGDQDPHAWQNLIAGKRYVANIRDGLVEADPENADAYTANAARYIDAIEAADDEVRALIDEIPATTSVITGHASFGHFAHAYGLRFMSLQGLSTDAEPSAADMAGLIEVIHEQDVRALFHENMTSPALLEQLAEETGLPIAGTLYADALASEGEASTWLGMIRHNAHTLHDALAEPGQEDHDHEDHGHDH
ncbi:zinc ABC transporter substrate-binding protein [Halomonas sp. KAO]|uniref:metal ABC transporter solute-binding protein, Zn/Mn family n=1 Tax=Halomonas sp. KAO TaxID=2783858 RepID=UPI00189F70FB|nr:zinc ABC transporter substrate-binding protein [Halomonas sp. KAO]MBF7054584.1 zinc ABC transporter substrate-binding protein [Halomonas sp. KAO]